MDKSMVLLKILGFTIPYERGSIHSNKLFKIYSLFVILSSTTLTLATWYYRLVINYKKMQATVVLTDVLESSTVLILHIILILYTVFLDEDSRTKFAVLMIDLNTVLSFSKKVKKMFTHEKVFIIVYFCTIALCVAYIGIWTKIVGFEMEKFFIVKEVQICVCVLGISQFYYLNLRLIDFLTNFNQMLSVCAECQEIVVTLTDQSSKDKKRSVSLKIEDFPRIYQKLCDVVDIANAVYGYPLLFCVSLIMMRIIGTINVSVVFDRYPLTICISVLWTLTSTVLAVMIINSCEAVHAEARKSGVIGYKLIFKLPIRPIKLEKVALRDNIMLLIRLVEIRNPQYSAAGFFDLNFATFLATLHSVTTYTIMLCTIVK